ncbi:MAG: hypothetical protein JSW58_16590 [Candidatus Latescibacterota bacterium]|nr:MAG: hypothetical protein JSW58_16590 [Candidatus Latescibacterota bacterium]
MIWPLDLKRQHVGITAISFIILGFLLVLTSSSAHAQCTPLSPRDCRLESNHPKDYSFIQSQPYWMVVGIVPSYPDDKDIYLFTECSSGMGLAGSTGINGIDYIVGDFNHNTPGTYYPQALYGDTLASYTVYWGDGGTVFPIGVPVDGTLGGSGAGCGMIQIWDVYLELGAEYRVSWNPPAGVEANAALFRNPGTGSYWAGRSESKWEVSALGSTYYTAPENDWYGLVVFPTWNLSTSEAFELIIEKLDDGRLLTAGACDAYQIYEPASGPGNDFTFVQGSQQWGVVAVVPDMLDDKTLKLYTACDGGGTYLGGSSTGGPGDTELVVGDFNHNTTGTYFARVSDGQIHIPFTIGWESGPDLFSVPGEVTGTIEETGENCAQARIWDVHFEAGKEYEIRFDGWGEKAPHLALFRNPGTSEYWGGRQDAEWELSGSVYHYYTAPQDDWYGLVVFANSRSESSSGYQILIQEMGDCVPITSGECMSFSGWPREFSYQQTDDYWSIVGVSVSDGDSKQLSIRTACDLKGTNLASSVTSNTGFIVGDFNHNALGTYYPSVTDNDQTATYTIQCDIGTDPLEDVFPIDELVAGSVGGTSGQCGLVRIWDIYLETGTDYDIGFTKNLAADVRLALFRNPGNGTYWATRADSEWELSESGNHSYTAPASDWYGLVVYSATGGLSGEYTIRISEQGATGIETKPTVPGEFALYQNVPNPFNPSTTIRYDVPAGGGRVTLHIYDVNGRLVRSLVDGVELPGEKSMVWDARDDRGTKVSTGVYFCRLAGPGFTKTHKLLLIK